MARTRTNAINVRVTEAEKRKLSRLAKYCGMSLSAYLRQVGLGKSVKALPPDELHEIYRLLTEAKESSTRPELSSKLDEALRLILCLNGGSNGDDKDMDDKGQP